MTTKEEFADYLLGSCHSLEDAMDTYQVNENFALKAIEAADIERCESCGWWCEMSELNEELVCNDCVEYLEE